MLKCLQNSSNTILDMMNISAPPSSAKAKKAFTPGEKITAYLKYNNESCIDTLKQLGITIRTVTPSVITAVIPVSAMEEAANLQGIDCIQTSQTVKFQMDSARVATVLTMCRRLKILSKLRSWEGVLVGVIDGGVDFTHPDFTHPTEKHYESNGSGYREIIAVRRRRISATARNIRHQSITTKGTDYSYFSHGSHVMGIAAGADTINNPYYGVAARPIWPSPRLKV
ncbi:MAG: S8 family serine peptidase [Barnesiella sp.]